MVGFCLWCSLVMAILDIQIVSASLSEIKPVSAPVRRSVLGADCLSDCRGDHDPLSGILARIVSTRVLFSCAAAGFMLPARLRPRPLISCR